MAIKVSGVGVAWRVRVRRSLSEPRLLLKTHFNQTSIPVFGSARDVNVIRELGPARNN